MKRARQNLIGAAAASAMIEGKLHAVETDKVSSGTMQSRSAAVPGRSKVDGSEIQGC